MQTSSMARTALYAGSFDPPTKGHLDIITRASCMCDHLIVCVAVNDTKHTPLLPLAVRIELLNALTKDLKNVSVVAYEGLLADFAKQNRVALFIRGIRNYIDFEREYALSIANRQLCGIDTLFLPCQPEFIHISSSLVRESLQFKGPIDHLVPAQTSACLKKIAKH